ncbi:hypothetical protein KCP73_20790 [Salmonella enterica subsp. enterica]|nr:hypothetical protein KCP73_20790 [Salmonella enterica subsp. enterica]
MQAAECASCPVCISPRRKISQAKTAPASINPSLEPWCAFISMSIASAWMVVSLQLARLPRL